MKKIIKMLQDKFEVSEFGGGKKGFVVCADCDAIYNKKHWHHKEKYGTDKFEEIKQDAKLELCPACKMIKSGLVDGFVVFKNVPEERQEEMLNLIKHIGERAFKNDVLDRIIKTERKDGNIEVSTTENQMAVSLAKQVERAFGGSLDIQWSQKDGPVRIFWTTTIK